MPVLAKDKVKRLIIFSKSNLNTHNLNQGSLPKQSQLISKVLSPAVRLWLRSQVEHVSHLEVKISGSDRQILNGHIPHMSVSACQAVYQGLHLDQIQLVGEGIRTNLRQILQGQPLRLLEPVIVYSELLLQEADLNASLQSSLLSNALNELLQMLLPESYLLEGQVSWHKMAIEPEHLTLSGSIADAGSAKQLSLRCGLQLHSGREILLTQPQLHISPSVYLEKLDDFRLDLGPQVDLQKLSSHLGHLVCCGRITVMPPD